MTASSFSTNGTPIFSIQARGGSAPINAKTRSQSIGRAPDFVSSVTRPPATSLTVDSKRISIRPALASSSICSRFRFFTRANAFLR
jgi:hypothetical protein